MTRLPSVETRRLRGGEREFDFGYIKFERLSTSE